MVAILYVLKKKRRDSHVVKLQFNPVNQFIMVSKKVDMENSNKNGKVRKDFV